MRSWLGNQISEWSAWEHNSIDLDTQECCNSGSHWHSDPESVSETSHIGHHHEPGSKASDTKATEELPPQTLNLVLVHLFKLEHLEIREIVIVDVY